MVIENRKEFESWLIESLGGKYKVKSNVINKIIKLVEAQLSNSALRVKCFNELEMYLLQETNPFIDLMLHTLESKSYVKKNETQSPVAATESVKLRKQKNGPPLKLLHLGTLDSPTLPMRDISWNELLRVLLTSQDRQVQTEACDYVSELILGASRPTIDQIIGVVPRLVSFLRIADNNDLQWKAARALTNIAAGTSAQTKVVVDEGAVKEFITLLSSPHGNLAEIATWALTNIVGDGPKARDVVINCGIIRPLMQIVDTENLRLLSNILWAITNLCRSKKPPLPPIDAKECLPVVVHVLNCRTSPRELISDACWAISYLSDGSDDIIEAVVQTGIVPQLVEFLDYPEVTIITPTLRAIGNIVTGNNLGTQCVIDANALPVLRKVLKCYLVIHENTLRLLRHRLHHPLRHRLHHRLHHRLRHRRNNEEATIVKLISGVISNIAAGTPEQLQSVIDAEIVPDLIGLLEHADLTVQKRGIRALSVFITNGNQEQIAYLIRTGFLGPYCQLLSCRDADVITIILNCFQKLLLNAEHFDRVEETCVLIEEAGGLKLMKEFQPHENYKIYCTAQALIEKYFGQEEEAELPPDEIGFLFPTFGPQIPDFKF